jgi:hypothetical protein
MDDRTVGHISWSWSSRVFRRILWPAWRPDAALSVDTHPGANHSRKLDGRVKLRAFGEVIVPAMRRDSANPATPFLSSRTIRFGIVVLF